jgi:Cadherin-like beta sandwich domain/Putative Ig domain/Secretion system C-terminal sorting domain/NHL repeat/Matrixin/IPT/TIG domain
MIMIKYIQKLLFYVILTLLFNSIFIYKANGQTITSFSPSSITAGTGSILTINGTGFGAAGPNSTNYIQFTGASAGEGVPLTKPLLSDYISWTNTQINVKVPSDAGTGIIMLVNGNSTINSTSSLSIPYDLLNTVYNNASYPVKLVNRNNSGGYTFQMFTDFNANTAANQSFIRAFKTWTCATNVNWNIGSPTTVNQAADDGVNVIRFASTADELDAGLAGEALSSYESIDGITFQVVDIDIVFAPTSTANNWDFGPGLPGSQQEDFETVALHELGHAQQLGHTNDINDVMNVTGRVNTLRTLNSNDINAGKYIMSISTANTNNSPYPSMIAFPTGSCNAPVAVINSFSPTTASPGTVVTIKGANFTGADAVAFGNSPAASFSVVSDAIITATVAIGTSGSISITTPGGIASMQGFIFEPVQNVTIVPPKISYNSPQTYTTGATITILKPTNNGGFVPATIYGETSAIAGSSISGSANGTGASATFSQPEGITIDATGNIYVADTHNNLIRKIAANGLVTTLAGNSATGSTNGIGTAASFYYPFALVADVLDNVYVADYNYGLIRKITSAGLVTTFALNFYGPQGLTNDAVGNIYVADTYNNQIKKITPAGIITTLAGSGIAASANGMGTAASFNHPGGVAIDATGNIYVADTKNNLIRKSTPTGLISTLAGNGVAGSANGVGIAASFNQPCGVAVDISGNVYVVDQLNYQIRKITPTGVVSTFATGLTYPEAVSIDGSGNLYLADYNMIKKIITTGYTISPSLPAGLSFDGTTGIISGKPTSASPTTTYTIAAYNGGGSSAATIQIKVTSSNADLANLAISSGPFSPAFDSNVTSYKTSVNNTISSITVTAKLSDSTAKLTVNGAANVSGTASTPISLNVGDNTIPVMVTAPDGVTTKTYTLIVTRAIPDIYTLPSDNFKLSITSATCKGSSNGSVNITASDASNYTATISGGALNASYSFTSSQTITALSAGSYSICISITGQPDYQQCFDAVITEPADLSAYATVNPKDNSVTLALAGGEQYNINLNGVIYTTTDNNITLPLKYGDNDLKVTTDKLCQGLIERMINVEPNIVAYPVPFQNMLNITLGDQNISNVTVAIYGLDDGKLVYTKQYINQSGVLQLDLTNLSGGVYALHITMGRSEKIIKILKQ